MNLSAPFMIFSVERKELSTSENAARTRFVCGLLQREAIHFVPAEGSYQHTLESGFVVFTYEGTPLADWLERIACMYNQDTVMYVDTARHAYLKDLRCFKYQPIGVWREVMPQDAEAAEGYTRIDGRFYVAQRKPA